MNIMGCYLKRTGGVDPAFGEVTNIKRGHTSKVLKPLSGCKSKATLSRTYAIIFLE
jgi:hypothetical protein